MSQRGIGFWIAFPFRWALWTAGTTGIPLAIVYTMMRDRPLGKMLIVLIFIIGALYFLERLWPDDQRDQEKEKG